MIRTSTLEESRATRHREVNLRGAHFGAMTDLIVPDGEGRYRPQGYLVQQAPGWNIPPHYHRQAQFQVVVRGDGTLGRHRVAPLCVHYASRESGYGPVIAGNDGLWYFTLRAVADTGIWNLPEKKSEMTAGLAKSQATSKLVDCRSEAQAFPDGSRLEPLIDRLKDGAAAWLLRVSPGGWAETPESAGAARFHVVVEGEARINDRRLPPLSIVFSSDDESRLAVQAGERGLTMAVMEFPER